MLYNQEFFTIKTFTFSYDNYILHKGVVRFPLLTTLKNASYSPAFERTLSIGCFHLMKFSKRRPMFSQNLILRSTVHTFVNHRNLGCSKWPERILFLFCDYNIHSAEQRKHDTAYVFFLPSVENFFPTHRNGISAYLSPNHEPITQHQ